MGKLNKLPILNCETCGKHFKAHTFEYIKKGWSRFCSHKCRKHFWSAESKGGYSALHDWIRRRLPRASQCGVCGQKSNLDLANKSGKYLQLLSDWEWLCRKCHMTSDGRLVALHSPGKQWSLKKVGIWARKYTECISCKSTQIKHHSLGLCSVCYHVNWKKHHAT